MEQTSLKNRYNIGSISSWMIGMAPQRHPKMLQAFDYILSFLKHLIELCLMY